MVIILYNLDGEALMPTAAAKRFKEFVSLPSGKDKKKAKEILEQCTPENELTILVISDEKIPMKAIISSGFNHALYASIS